MAEFSRRQAADRAGVSLAALDRLIELNLVSPNDMDRFTAGEVRKIGLLASLMAGGIPEDALATARRNGGLSLDFLDDPSYENFSALSDVTFEALSERAGISVDLLLTIR